MCKLDRAVNGGDGEGRGCITAGPSARLLLRAVIYKLDSDERRLAKLIPT